MNSNKANLSLIKLFTCKEYFDRWYRLINKEILTDEQRKIFNGFYLYYNENDCPYLPMDEFITWFTQTKHTNLNANELEFYIDILNKAANYEVQNAEMIIDHFHKMELKAEIQTEISSDKFEPELIQEKLDQYKNKSNSSKYDHVIQTMKASELYSEEIMKPKFTYKLDGLNQIIKGIFHDDFIMMSAPQHTGKTAFLVDLAIHVGKQIKDNGKVYYLSNEEAEDRLANRIMTAACLQEKRACTEGANYADSFLEKYLALDNETKDMVYQGIGLKEDTISTVNISDMSIHQINQFLLDKKDASLIIVDMINQINGIKSEKEHIVVQRLAQYFKNVVKRNKCPVIAAHQAKPGTSKENKESGDVEHKMWLSHIHLQGGQQATSPADVFIGIGTCI